MKDNKDINEMEKFEEIPIEDFPSDMDESYLDKSVEKTDDTKKEKDEK